MLNSTPSDFICPSKPGSIILSTTGGSAPYLYNWGGGINSQNRNNLNSGIYSVTVTDANGCSQSGSITVNSLPQMNAALDKKDATCFGQNDGSVMANVTGGTLPYRFLWNNSAATQGLLSVSAGTYTVQVTDSNSCIITGSAIVNQPPAIAITPAVVPVSCNGGSNGSINTAVTGGTPGYKYAWNNNSISPSISNLSPGTYSLTVTDIQHCSTVDSGIIIGQPSALNATTSPTPVGCDAGKGGDINVTVSGGNPPYTFSWSNQSQSQDLSGLVAGVYTVTVSDSKNCTTVTSASITAPNPIVITAAVQNAKCTGSENGAVTLNISGGAPAFSFEWSNGEQTENLSKAAPGNYSVTVTDAGGCTATSGFVITSDYTLSVSISGNTSINEGESTTLIANASSDFDNVYQWGPEESVHCVSCQSTQVAPLQTQEFTVAVVDSNGCKANATITIDVNTQVNIYIPNVFSPNGDGHNDYFSIYGEFSPIVYLDVNIFDRWGEKVFEANDPKFAWDGTYKGQPAPQGVYVYTMTAAFADGSHKDYKGSVTLLR